MAKKMVDFIRERFAGKSVVLLGFGREGQASYNVLRRAFPDKELAIADSSESVRENPLIRQDSHLELITGEDYLDRISGFDYIFRSPGIPIWRLLSRPEICPEGNSTARQLSRPAITLKREQITSQTELFLLHYAKQVIGITGTKGKSTTSALIHHIFKTAGADVLLTGNIGNPVFHFIDMIRPETKIVFELSSHQLEYLSIAPHISVLLNLFQEHLDAYPSYLDYQLAKLNITRYQQEGDYLIYNADDVLVASHAALYCNLRKSFPFSLQSEPRPGGFIRDGWICFSNGINTVPVWKVHQDRFLRGEHNLKNIIAAVNVAMISGIDIEVVQDGIATFKIGRAHV